MKAKKEFKVFPKLTDNLKDLLPIAFNLRFSWQEEVRNIFKRIDPQAWIETGGNPVALLYQVSQERLDYLETDPGFISQVKESKRQLDEYVNRPRRDDHDMTVAYLSAEFGLARCLPIYSGGLGILAGDHLKSSSDLNIPLVGVGLLYQEGYFNQYLNTDGWQMESNPVNDFDTMPIKKVKNEQGEQIKVKAPLRDREVTIGVWLVSVGRTPLYLLDTNLPENPPEFRNITARLYGGDKVMRLYQEIVLGIGGIRALNALNIKPTVVHMNEGHSAFSALERINILRNEKGLSFDEAREIVQATTIFTTHTPVPAGNDTFDPSLAQSFFEEYAKQLGINWRVLLGYGRINPRDENEFFGVTPLALRLSAHANGVSLLHGEVSRNMWKDIWPKNPIEDVPIGHVTNGIHVPTWASSEISRLYNRQLGANWTEDADSESVWDQIKQLSLSELWQAHTRCRESLIAHIRRLLFNQLRTRGADSGTLREAMEVLNPEYLTIGFARRFATYKRATMVFRDLERLKKIIKHSEHPVQFIFAGKAHPQDNEGKAFIKQIYHLSREEEFKDRVVFLEDYNMDLASLMLSGCDVWLNNPRRPQEACGTSGMKAVANGVLNLSVLDGWWNEGYKPGLGWAIGQGENYYSDEIQDETESLDLYNLLEKQVVPLFYHRAKDGVPVAWCEMMRNSILKLMPVFNSNRMVQDYLVKYYRPCSARYHQLTDNKMEGAKKLAVWRHHLMTSWGDIKITDVDGDANKTNSVGDKINVTSTVELGNLTPEDVSVVAYYGPMNHQGDFTERKTALLTAKQQNNNGVWDYEGIIECQEPGRFGYTIRITPCNKRLENSMMFGLITWA